MSAVVPRKSCSGTWWGKLSPILLLGMLLASVAAQEGNRSEHPDAATSARIGLWIGQLGDPQYATREKAQEELRRAGTVAFDDLLAAQDHPDVEIAQRARYLVRSMPVAWSQESDPPEVKSLLTDFGQKVRSERLTIAQHLARLEGGVGIVPLCRIARYEADRILSKRAALLIMTRPSPTEPAQREDLAAAIRRGMATSTRPAADWLLTYSRELAAPSSTHADWDRIAREELTTLAKTPQHSDREVARDLLRWQATLLLNREQLEQALACVRRTYDLIRDEVTDIYEVIDWSIEHQLYIVPEEVASRFAHRTANEPRLLYRVAEAQKKRGADDRAEKTAEQARQLHPAMPDEHLTVALLLYQRGLIDWSINEYRFVIEREMPKLDSPQSLEARDALSRMFVDLERELEAVEVIQPLIEMADAKQEVASETMQLVDTYFRGNIQYWRAVHFARQGDRAKQIEHLKLAIQAKPDDIDILIAMYRVPDPDEGWKKDVQTRIDSHLGKCRSLIGKYEEIIRRQPNFEGAAGDQLATCYNELAWLISNTSGDAQEAIRASRRSLELSPESEAYLDTLGRCYFAAGDPENAVKFQRRAVAIAPHMQVMQRQLKLFESKLAESKSETEKKP